MSNEYTNTETGAINLASLISGELDVVDAGDPTVGLAHPLIDEPLHDPLDPTAPAGFITPANHGDAVILETLIDRAYRQRIDGAWTTEAGRVAGQRVSAQEIHDLVDNPTMHLMVARNYSSDHSIDGCIMLEMHPGHTVPELGLFAVDPTHQARGIGRALVTALEEEALARGYTSLRLMVLHERPELQAWYERLGFHLTGKSAGFPEGTPSRPLEENPRFLEMAKTLQ